MSNIETVAIFDLDYTLTKRGTWGRFVWRTVRFRPHLWLPLLLSTLSFQIQYKRGKLPRGAVKKNMMRWSLQSLQREKLEVMAESFAKKEVSQGLRLGGLAALDYHRSQGHRLVIASAAVDLIVLPIARELNISDFVSTELDWTKEGRLNADFASPNCYGEAKLVRVKHLLSTYNTTDIRTYFYSDSKADLPVLDYADIPVVVDPSDEFRAIAEARHMPIQHWMQSSEGFFVVVNNNGIN